MGLRAEHGAQHASSEGEVEAASAAGKPSAASSWLSLRRASTLRGVADIGEEVRCGQRVVLGAALGLVLLFYGRYYY